MINPGTAGECKVAPPSFFLNISVARRNFPLRFGGFLEPSKPDEMALRFSKKSNPLSNYLTGSEGGVDDFVVENVINLVTIQSKGVDHLWKQRCCICF